MSTRLLRGWLTYAGPGKGVSADFAVGAGSPPRLGLDGKPELTEAPRLRATAGEGIPEGFRGVPIALPDAMGHQPGRVAPGGAEARSPSPARNESGGYRSSPEILKSQYFNVGTQLRNRGRLCRNSSRSRRVRGPGRAAPILVPSTSETGRISMLVFVRKHSSAFIKTSELYLPS